MFKVKRVVKVKKIMTNQLVDQILIRFVHIRYLGVLRYPVKSSVDLHPPPTSRLLSVSESWSHFSNAQRLVGAVWWMDPAQPLPAPPTREVLR